MGWYQGQLLGQDQFKRPQAARRGHREKAEVAQQRPASQQGGRNEGQWTAYWQEKTGHWLRALQRKQTEARASMERDMAEAQGPMAVRTLGSLLIRKSWPPKEQDAWQVIGLTLIHQLDYCTEAWALSELLWQAVDHPIKEVRKAAAFALKSALEESVPNLLARMRLPAEAKLTVCDFGWFGVMLQCSLERESLDAYYVEQYNGSTIVHPPRLIFDRDLGLPQGPVSRQEIRDALAQQARETFRAIKSCAPRSGGKCPAFSENVEATNAEAAEINPRVRYALYQITGEDLPTNPIACQKWWRDYYYQLYEMGNPYEYEDESHGQKPVYESRSSYDQQFTAPPIMVSCFPRDIKVWTLAGPVPIERVQPGDLVLSQHPRTGELAYKPVLEVTAHKPVPLVKIGLGAETILATRGHPFWVCGKGWKMAKQLEVGDRLHTLSGPVTIDRLDQKPTPGPWYEQLRDRPDAKPEELRASLQPDR